MILLKIFRYILGFLRIKIIGEFPEQLLNALANKNIPTWNVMRKDDYIEVDIRIKDYIKIRKIRKNTGCRSLIIKKYGLLFKTRKYRKRWGFIIGLSLFIVGIFSMTQFIWNINIIGNSGIEKNDIITALTELGLKEGCRISSVDSKSLVPKLKLKISDIAWASVNIEGTVANVEITERKYADVESTEPSNLIADDDGIIVAVKVLDGVLKVKPGDAVRKGSLLVSGVREYKYGTFDFVRSHGEIIARTRDKISFSIPYEQIYTVKTGKEIQKSIISFTDLKIPMFLTYPDFLYECKISIKRIEAMGNYIPIYLTTYKFFETEERTTIIDREAAEHMAVERLTLEEKEKFNNCKVIASDVKITEYQNGIYLEVEYVIEKNIAFEEKIIISTVNQK